MNKIRVIDAAWLSTGDIDSERHVDVKVLDGLLRRCVGQVTEVLKSSSSYPQLQRWHLVEMFEGLGSTHVTIRNLLAHGSSNPGCVDAVPLARLQLETLYRICLIAQDASYLNLYIKNFWKDHYVRFLIAREEQKNLPRFASYLNQQGPTNIERFRQLCGVTNEEKTTVEHDELGTPLPPGIKPVQIKEFPQPRRVIEEITNSDQKRMLKRLYLDYRRLCGFAHGSAQSSFFKTTFSKNSVVTQLTTESQRQDVFDKEILDLSLLHSSLSVIQGVSEMVNVFPADIELARACSDAWNLLADMNLLGRAVWEMRAKPLLKVI